MPQWIDITPSSSRRTTKKTEEDTTNWVDITPSTYKPPEHPFTGPELPPTLMERARTLWNEPADTFKKDVNEGISSLWHKATDPIAKVLEPGLTALPPFRQTPQFQKAMEEFNAEHPIAAIPGKFANAGTQFGTSPIGIATILSAGVTGPLAAIGEAGSLARNAGTIGSQVIHGLGELGGAGMGVAAVKHAIDTDTNPNLNNWQKAGGFIESLGEIEMGKAGAGVYHGGPPEGLKKVGDANIPPPPPPPPGTPPPGVTFPESPLSPQRSFDFGQPEPHLPFHGEPSMDVRVPFDERFQRTPIGITSRPGVPETRPQTPRPIEGPQIGPYGTDVGQPRLPLTDEFGQGELGLPLTHPEANPSAMPYERRGADVPPPKAEGETVAPDATQQPHVISARGMTQADIDMLRSQGYESGGQGADGYAQMIRKAGPPTTAAMTTPTSTPPPVAGGATSVDVRAGQPVRVPKDALTSQLIERLKAQGFEKTGNDVNGDGLFTRVIKETGGWGDDAQLAQFFRDFFKREPSIEELADAAIPGDGRKGLFMKIMGTIHDTRNADDLRRQVEILNEQKGIALNSGEPDAAYNLADLHREASDRLLAFEGEGAPPGSLPGQRPQLPPDEQVRSFSDALDDLHGQLEAGYDINEEILGEIQDKIKNAKDIHEAMHMSEELGVMEDNAGDPIMRDLYERLHQVAFSKYHEFVRAMQDQPVPQRNRSVAEVSNTLSSLIRHGMTDEAEIHSLLDELERGINNEVDHNIIQENLLRLHNLAEAPDVSEGHQQIFQYLLEVAQEKFSRSVGQTPGGQEINPITGERIGPGYTPDNVTHTDTGTTETYENAPPPFKGTDEDIFRRAPELRGKTPLQIYDMWGKASDPYAVGDYFDLHPDIMDQVREQIIERNRTGIGGLRGIDPNIQQEPPGTPRPPNALNADEQAAFNSHLWNQATSPRDIARLHAEAAKYGVNPADYPNNGELSRAIAAAQKKLFDQLRNADIRPRQIYEIAEDLRNKLTEGDENGIEALMSEAENTITNETDPAIIKDNLDQLNGYLDQARLHGTPDDIEFLGQLRDTALDKLRRGPNETGGVAAPTNPLPPTEPPIGSEAVPPSGEIEDLRQQNGLEGITGPPTDEPVDLGQTPTLRDFIRDTSGEERYDELGRRIGIPQIKAPLKSIERPEIEYQQARIQAVKNPVFIERMTREYMDARIEALRDKDWDKVHEMDRLLSQLSDRRSEVYSELYPDTPLSPTELEKRGQQQLPGMAAAMDSGRPLTEMPPQTPMGVPEQRPPTQGQLPMSRRPKIGRIPGLTIDKIKEAEASLAPDEWDPGRDHEWGTKQLEGFTPQKGQPGLSVADVNGDTAIGVRDIGQIVYRNAQGTRPLVVARIELMQDGSGKMGVRSLFSKKDGGAAQGRGVIEVLKKLVEIDALRVNGEYSSWTRDVIHGLRDFIDDTGGWGDDSQLWENIKRRTGWGQGGKVQPPKLDPQGQPIKELNLLKELIAVPSAATTTGDLSASGRQALPFIFTPEFWKAQWPQLKAGWSKDAFDRINAQLEDLPLFRQRLDLTTGDLKPSLANELGMKLLKASDHIDEREAAIASRWLETGGNIPGFSRAYGATIGRYIRGSNRAYMTLLNHIRANRTQKLFDLSRDMSVKALETGEARPGFFKQKYTAQEALDLDPYTNKVLGKEIVDFVNTATGRGPLKTHIIPYRKAEISLEGSADKLGYLLFAPRMIASRMRMLNPSTYIMASPFVRKQYLKAAISTAAAWMAINQMGKLAGAETNDDLDSADFGKMRFGDTRLDPAGGFQQFMVAYHRLYTGGYSSSSTGAWHRFGKGFQAQTQYDQGERLFSNKLNPVAKFAWDVLNASEYQPFHVYDRTAQLFVPLIIQDIYELAKEDPSLLPLVAPVAFGMGTQTYSKGESVGKFIQPEDDWLATGGGLQDLLPEGWQQER